jgi:hypothetical protein
MLIQDALSLQYVQASVTTTAEGTAVNPTGDVVAFAFTAVGAKPASGDWQVGSWDGTTPRADGSYVAQCLVGPGGTIALTVAKYMMWVRVTDNPEIPVIDVGVLSIT